VLIDPPLPITCGTSLYSELIRLRGLCAHIFYFVNGAREFSGEMDYEYERETRDLNNINVSYVNDSGN
jgi:hypothetical protein